MEVTLDGRRLDLDREGHAGLLPLLQRVIDTLELENRALMGVAVDGKPLDPFHLAEDAARFPLDQIGMLELTSADIHTMTGQAIESLRAHVPELPVACHSLAALFHGEHPEDGYGPFESFAEIWGFIKNQERLVVNALGLELGDIDVRGMSLVRMHEELNGFLEEAAQSLKNQDCVLLGDLLEYELAPRAEKEADIVALLAERHAAGAVPP